MQIILTWELFEQGVPKSYIAQHLVRNREKMIVWIKAIAGQGLHTFSQYRQTLPEQPSPARQMRVTSKRPIWAIREREGQ